ncbi:MAG: NAD-dependent epimerase/dehydratase family protein [Candidatus Tritonobacter lacicola]|nr:NAD-dependent epimerase/dehydratase family protein [Candidatus Tritonobacter lacicola]
MDVIKGKTLFITGGAGFIGTALARRLVDDNRIIVYDSLRRDSMRDTNLREHPNLTFIKGDVLDCDNLAGAMAGADIVVHMAAIAGIDTVTKNTVDTMKVNLIGTFNILEAARELKLSRFVDFSTSEVFGAYCYKEEEDGIARMGTVGEVRWTYAVSKLAGEHLLFAYLRQYGLPGIAIRPFNVYGPGQVGEGAIHHFVKRAIADEEIIIHGDGDQIRSWCYIDDLLEGLLLCLTKEEAIGNVFNIGNPRGTVTIHGLARTVVRVLKSGSPIRYVPKSYADVELRIPTIEKAREILGFMPRVDLEEGILKTAEWYRNLASS